MARWIGKFYAKLFPEIVPLHGRGPKWITLQGGPGHGRKFKLTLRVGDTLQLPVASALSISEIMLPSYPRIKRAIYRLEPVLDERHRMRLIGVYKGMGT